MPRTALSPSLAARVDRIVKEAMKESAARENKTREDRSFRERYPDVGRIRPDDRMGAQVAPRGVSRSDADNASFEARFPVAGAARIKTV